MVSIVVPVYNAEKYILETIRTVENQTYKDWELILVDDCSTDNSTNLIEKEATRCDKIRLIRKTVNEGAAKARNTGIDAARGEYLAFLDADDIWKPEKLEHELRFMKRHHAEFVFSSYLFGDENGKPTGKAVRVPEKMNYEEALTRTVIFTSTVLLDLRALGKEMVRMPDIPSEDTATWWQILRTGITAYGLDELLAVYRRSDGTLSSNKWNAVKRIWNLYRKAAGLGFARSCCYLLCWAWRAAARRIVDDSVRTRLHSLKH